MYGYWQIEVNDRAIGTIRENLIPSSKSSSKLKHNPLSGILEYAFLGEENTLSENILSSLDGKKK